MSSRDESRSLPPTPTIWSVIRRPLWVGLVALALLGVNVGVAYLDLFQDLEVTVHLVIAAVTVFFIAFIFMDLESKGSLYRLFAATGLLWICILFLLVYGDYATRHGGDRYGPQAVGPETRLHYDGTVASKLTPESAHNKPIPAR